MKTVQQFAVQFDPPTLLVEYKQGPSVYVRRIRIKQSNDWIQEEVGPVCMIKFLSLKNYCSKVVSAVRTTWQRESF